MAQLPILKNEYINREVTDSFSGYRRRLRIEEGQLYDCRNLSTQNFPLLSNRPRRSRLCTVSEPQGLMAKDRLLWVDGGVLYYDGEPTPLDKLSPGEKQLVSMGAYICVFPDRLYYNTAEPTDYGSMEAHYSSVGAVRYSLCTADGGEMKKPSVSDSAPENPENAALWIDSSQSPHLLRQWSEVLNEWISLPTVYTRISFSSGGEIGRLFAPNDGVTISGSAVVGVNGQHIITALGGDESGGDYIIIPGLLEEAYTQEEGALSVRRSVPEMDFVVECCNRLWGCKYGSAEGQNLNEIYCCALGDFKNWWQYRGLASDSWTASVGSDGPFTGAVNFQGSPIFFKENRLHKVIVSGYGAHQIKETVCRGVQPGCEKSLALVNETLYYKARGDVLAYQGGFPLSVSEALGDEKYSEAVAGAIGDSYYISMKNDSTGDYELFVYDVKREIWIKQDDMQAEAFAPLEGELYAISDGGIIAMLGSRGEKESYVSWMAESGILYYQYPDRKYLSRYNFRLQMEEGAQMDIFIQYDSSGLWERKGRIKFKGTGTVTVPIRPRRCDHMRIRLEGKGEFRLFSITKILSIGSDV